MLSDDFQQANERPADQGVTPGAWAGEALVRASARAQLWYETVRAYRRAYTKSRHFGLIVD